MKAMSGEDGKEDEAKKVTLVYGSQELQDPQEVPPPRETGGNPEEPKEDEVRSSPTQEVEEDPEKEESGKQRGNGQEGEQDQAT